MVKIKRNQTFMQGALILLVASVAVKVIGAMFKIPLQHLIGDDGMGMFNQAYQIYIALFVISTAGVPAALSKMIAESHALGREREVGRIVRLSAAMFLSVGLIGSALMFFGAGWIANAVKNPPAEAAIRMVAPSVALVCLVSIARGYFQGLSDMVPTAISQLIEACCKLGIGYGMAVYAIRHGFAMPICAAFAISGVTVGELLAVLYLLLRTLFAGRRTESGSSTACRSYGALAKSIILIAIPVTVAAAVTSVTTLIDTALVMVRLQAGGVSLAEANTLYGAYTAKAFTMFNLPQTLITALSVAMLPAISGAYARGDEVQASRTTGSAMRIAMLIALPAAIGYLVLAKPILTLLFVGEMDVAARLLQLLAFAVPCVAVVGLTNAILQGTGNVRVPVASMLCGAIVKLLCNYLLVSNPAVGIYGAPIGTLACYITISAINLLFLRRVIHLPALDKLLIRPFLACVGMGAMAAIVQRLLGGMLGKYAVLLSIVCGGVVYLILLLALHALEREDILLLPAGKRLVRLLHL